MTDMDMPLPEAIMAPLNNIVEEAEANGNSMESDAWLPNNLLKIQDAIRACAAELLAVAKRRADHEASAAAHHSGTWHEAFQHHLTRHKAMRDLIDAVWPDASIRASAMPAPEPGAETGTARTSPPTARPT